MAKNSTVSIRRRILKHRGVTLEKATRKPVTHDDLPSIFSKTQLMKYMELKFSSKLEDIIFDGTIYEVEKRIGIDATTVSKWRKIVSEAKDKKFWSQFQQPRPSPPPVP